MERFVVSARKYRPSDFESVVGQGHITSTLQNAISRKQLAHAYLFCGPRGVGKTTCARIFAKTINCLSPHEGEACGECESCRAFDEGRSFNIHELDAASNNSVDDIRSLTEQIRIPPQIGRYSVYIIDEVHMLTTAAFNAFLKSLEEPPAHAIFILATTEKHKIISTILSRCQIFDFNRIRVIDAVDYLRKIAVKEGITIDDEALNLIAVKADGGMRDALSMFDKAVAFCGDTLNYREVAHTLNVLDSDTYFNVTDIIARGEYREAVVAYDEVVRAGFSAQSFVSGLSAHFRDLLMCKDAETGKLLEVTETLMERYRQQSAAWSVESLFRAIAELQITDSTLRYATNQRLNVELCLMKLCGLGQKKNDDIAEIEPLTLPSPALVIDATKAEDPARSAEKPASQTAIISKQDEILAFARTAGNTEITNVTVMPDSNGIVAVVSPSIAETLRAGTAKPTNVEITNPTGDSTATMIAVDPDCEDKFSQAHEEILKQIALRRPRLLVAFEQVNVKGNVVTISTPTDILRDEVLEHRGELLRLIAEIANIRGDMELNVVVVQPQRADLPIRQEDIVAYMFARNAAFGELVKTFGLEY